MKSTKFFSMKISSDKELESLQKLLNFVNHRYDVHFYIYKTVPTKKGWDVTIKTDEESVRKIMSLS